MVNETLIKQNKKENLLYLIDFKPLDSSVDDGPVLREDVHEIFFRHDGIDLKRNKVNR